MKRRITSLILTAAMLLSLLLGCVSCAANESPKALFQKAISRTAEKMENVELIQTAEKTAAGGSVCLLAEDLDFGDGSEKGRVSFTLYANTDKKTAAAVLDAKLGEKTYKGGVYASSSAVVAECKEILGEKAYGLNIDKAAKNIAKSVFAPEGESKYSMSDEEYDKLLDVIKDLKETSKTEKEFRSLYEKYVKKLYKLISDNAEYEKDTDAETTVFDERDVPAVAVTVKLSSDAIVSVLKSLWKDAKADKDLKNFIKERLLSLIGKYEDVGDLYDDIDDEVDLIADTIEEDGVSVVIKYWLNSSGAIMKAEATLKAGGQKVVFSAELGKTFKTFEGLKVSIKRGDQDAQYFWIRVTQDDKEAFRCTIESNIDGIPEASLKYTKEDGIVKVTVKQTKRVWNDNTWEYENKTSETVVKLGYTKKGSVYTLTLGSVTVDGDKVELPYSGKYSLIVNKSASAPKAPSKYTDVLTMDEEAFEDFLEDSQKGLKELAGAVNAGGGDLYD